MTDSIVAFWVPILYRDPTRPLQGLHLPIMLLYLGSDRRIFISNYLYYVEIILLKTALLLILLDLPFNPIV